MVKKNLIGIVIVIVVAAAFGGGYLLGNRSASSQAIPFDRAMAVSGGEQAAMGQPGNASQPASPIISEHATGESSLTTAPADQSVAEPVADPGTTLPPQASATGADSGPAESPMTVTASTTLQDTYTFYGTAAASAEVNVQSSQGGTIITLKGKEGDSVKKGDVLVRFDDNEQRLAIETAQSSRNTALAKVSQAESELKAMQTTVERNQSLFEEGLISQQGMDDLLNNLETAQLALHSANESVKQADTTIALLEKKLNDFAVRAPISGIIDAKNYNLQEIYSANGVLYHLINIDQVYVNVDVPETYIKQIREGMQVSLTFNALGDQVFSGVVETILSSGATSARNFTVKILVDNPNHVIKPGMFASVEIAFTEV